MSDRPCFGYQFAKLHRIMLALCKEGITGLGIQLSQMPFLLALFRADGPMTQDDLSLQLSIDKAATTRALGQLEKNGLVFRKVNPQNRRQKYVSATAKAHGLADRMTITLQSVTDRLTKGFSSDELATANNILNRMISNAMDEMDKM